MVVGRTAAEFLTRINEKSRPGKKSWVAELFVAARQLFSLTKTERCTVRYVLATALGINVHVKLASVRRTRFFSRSSGQVV